MSAAGEDGRVPYARAVALDPAPHLTGVECSRCGARYFARRNGCGRCGATELYAFDAPSTGTVESYTVVHRSLPGVEVPYVAVIVGIDGGGALTGVLRGADALEPHELVGLRVRAVFEPLARRGADVAIGYLFEPEGMP